MEEKDYLRKRLQEAIKLLEESLGVTDNLYSNSGKFSNSDKTAIRHYYQEEVNKFLGGK